jgi:ABC-type polysaccharide/polyol phosphate export permease
VSVITDAPSPLFRLRRSPAAIVSDVVRSRELLRALTRRLLHVRYARHALGVLWTFINVLVPLAVLLVLRRHVGHVPRGVSGFAFLYSGLVCWQFFSTSVNDASSSLVSDSSIAKRIDGAREVIPLSRVAVAGLTALITATVLLGFGFLHGDFALSASAVLVVPTVAVGLLALAVGASLLLSPVVVYARDLNQVIGLVLQFGIFYSPILFPLADIPVRYRLPYVLVNPVGGYIEALRDVLLLHEGVPWAYLGVSVAMSTLVLVVGATCFRILLPKVIDLA